MRPRHLGVPICERPEALYRGLRPPK
jgi:hypothetical protein